VQFISNYEHAMARMARERGADGIICGHIHHAEIREIDGILYLNDGDWVEGCTALVEHSDGRWEVLHWAELRGLVHMESVSADLLSDDVAAREGAGIANICAVVFRRSESPGNQQQGR
jgi:hypothetical protein